MRTQNFSVFQYTSFILISNNKKKEGINMLYIDNLNYNQYPYEYPIGCPDVDNICRELEGEILGSNPAYICDLMTDISTRAVDIYDSQLFEKTMNPKFSKYIDDSILEFGMPEKNENFLANVLRTAEYSYFYEQLYFNLENAIKNAIINYLNKSTITYSQPEDKERIIDFIDDYIDGLSPDSNARAESVITDFERALFSKFKTEFKPKETKLIGLYVKPNEFPIKVEIDKSNTLKELQNLVDGYIECLSLYNENGMTDIILNEEGKINGMQPNRIVSYHQLFGNGNQQIADIIFGSFVILNSNDDGEFVGLSEEDFQKWGNEFANPESPFLGSFFLDNEFLDFPTSSKTDDKNSRTYRGDER